MRLKKLEIKYKRDPDFYRLYKNAMHEYFNTDVLEKVSDF